MDWLAALRAKIEPAFVVGDNVGVGLPWETALAALEKSFGLPVQFREAVASASAIAIERSVSAHPGLVLVDDTIFLRRILARTGFPVVTALAPIGSIFAGWGRKADEEVRGDGSSSGVRRECPDAPT